MGSGRAKHNSRVPSASTWMRFMTWMQVLLIKILKSGLGMVSVKVDGDGHISGGKMDN